MAGALAVHTDSIGRLVGAGGAVRSDISFLLLHERTFHIFLRIGSRDSIKY